MEEIEVQRVTLANAYDEVIGMLMRLVDNKKAKITIPRLYTLNLPIAAIEDKKARELYEDIAAEAEKCKTRIYPNDRRKQKRPSNLLKMLVVEFNARVGWLVLEARRRPTVSIK